MMFVQAIGIVTMITKIMNRGTANECRIQTDKPEPLRSLDRQGLAATFFLGGRYSGMDAKDVEKTKGCSNDIRQRFRFDKIFFDFL